MSARLPEPGAGRRRAAMPARNLVVLGTIGIAVVIAGVFLAAQEGDGSSAVVGRQGGQRTYAVSGFDGISAVAAKNVDVSVGPAFSVRGSGSADALDRFEVVVDDGTLKIEPKHSAWWHMPWSTLGPVTFTVVLPRLTEASFVGSGTMKIDRVAGPRFEANVAGSGQMDIAALTVDEAELSVAGSGDLSARGKVKAAHVSVAGSGDMKAAGLTSDTAELSMIGSGDAALTVNRQADVSIVGSGDVVIGGSAHCAISRIGSGDVKCPA